MIGIVFGPPDSAIINFYSYPTNRLEKAELFPLFFEPQSLVAMWFDKTKTGHPSERVKDITAKTLLIRGDNDFLVSLGSLSELKGKIKGSSFMNLPFAEHVVYEEQSQMIKVMLKQF